MPLVLEFNGSEVWAQRHWGERLRFEALGERVERASLRNAELVVVVSQALVEQAVERGARASGSSSTPTASTRYAFDPLRFTAEDRQRARAELDVPADADLLTFVGTFGTWHGTDILATAIRRLIDEDRAWLERRRVHFLYVGDGPLAPRVRSILGEGLGRPFVTLAGIRPQAETPRTLAASDILLSPHVPNPDGTPFFGSPTKLFEYMAMGKPIVASDLDQIGWVLKGWRPGEPPPAPRRVGKGPGGAPRRAGSRGRARRRHPAGGRDAGGRARGARAGGPPPRSRVVHVGPERRRGSRPPAGRGRIPRESTGRGVRERT